MTKILFPIWITGQLETDICAWIGETHRNGGKVFYEDGNICIEDGYEDLILILKLKFGL